MQFVCNPNQWDVNTLMKWLCFYLWAEYIKYQVSVFLDSYIYTFEKNIFFSKLLMEKNAKETSLEAAQHTMYRVVWQEQGSLPLPAALSTPCASSPTPAEHPLCCALPTAQSCAPVHINTRQSCLCSAYHPLAGPCQWALIFFSCTWHSKLISIWQLAVSKLRDLFLTGSISGMGCSTPS